VTEIDEAKTWFAQAASDLRTAKAILGGPAPMHEADVGCHLAAMCAQVTEKSLKGYMVANRTTPSLDHRPDKYIARLLTKGGLLLQHEGHHSHLSKLFHPATKAAVRQLFDLTPGGRGNRTDMPNTEYPWKINGAWMHTPAGALELSDSKAVALWLKISERIYNTLQKLVIAGGRGSR